MLKTNPWLQAELVACREVADNVRQLDFAVHEDLPGFNAGSHSNFRVTINGEPASRTYTCLPSAHGIIRIAVKLHPRSRGGSRFMWSLQPGDRLALTAPENRFELSWRAKHYLLIAGGIGITPILGMAKTLSARDQSMRLVYGGANLAGMPFTDELTEMLGDRLALAVSDQDQHIDFDSEIAALPEDGELYICGSLGMLEAAKAAWARAKRPVSRFRCEGFGDNGQFAEKRFQVEIVESGITVSVGPDQSMLGALLDAGVDMIYECERGECGLCAVDVVAHDGEIDHRDMFFSKAEKQENRKMCVCVSRLTGGKATIDVGYRSQ